MAHAAMFGSRQMIDAPLDPEGNDTAFRSTHSYGIQALARALLKFEHWDELLDDYTIPWRDIHTARDIQAMNAGRIRLGFASLDPRL